MIKLFKSRWLWGFNFYFSSMRIWCLYMSSYYDLIISSFLFAIFILFSSVLQFSSIICCCASFTHPFSISIQIDSAFFPSRRILHFEVEYFSIKKLLDCVSVECRSEVPWHLEVSAIKLNDNATPTCRVEGYFENWIWNELNCQSLETENSEHFIQPTRIIF